MGHGAQGTSVSSTPLMPSYCHYMAFQGGLTGTTCYIHELQGLAYCLGFSGGIWLVIQE